MSPYYADDHVTLYHARWEDVPPDLLRADVLVTDPPYGIGWSLHAAGRKTKMRGARPHPGIEGDQDTVSRDSFLDAWADRPGVVFGSWRAPFPARLKQVLVFHKSPDTGLVGSTTGYRNDWELIFLTGAWPRRDAAWSGVLRSSLGMNATGGIQDIGHPHAKPLDVMVPLVDRCPPGTILDPFAGSGSTLVAAKSLNRKAIGVECVEAYCEVAANRLRQEVLGLSA
jgi:site-specific DNA-methyltransferase (adenine-specific)